jgi:hypothetical protein
MGGIKRTRPLMIDSHTVASAFVASTTDPDLYDEHTFNNNNNSIDEFDDNDEFLISTDDSENSKSNRRQLIELDQEADKYESSNSSNKKRISFIDDTEIETINPVRHRNETEANLIQVAKNKHAPTSSSHSYQNVYKRIKTTSKNDVLLSNSNHQSNSNKKLMLSLNQDGVQMSNDNNVNQEDAEDSSFQQQVNLIDSLTETQQSSDSPIVTLPASPNLNSNNNKSSSLIINEAHNDNNT